MKFQTTDLVARIDSLLTKHEAELAAKATEAERKAKEGKEEWVATHQSYFLDFAKAIQYLSKKGEPITVEAAPKEIRDRWGNQINFYSAPSNWNADKTHIERLKHLKNALLANQEGTVSPTAIKQLGFQDVTFLFTAGADKQ